MIGLNSYAPNAYDTLRSFDRAKRDLDIDEKWNHISDLGDIIIRHGLHDSIGISLLHKHLDMFADEILVKEFDGNKAFISPSTNKGKTNPYMWKINKGDYYPLEFVRSTKRSRNIVKSSIALTESKDFLCETANYLAQKDLEEVFGISILPMDTICLKSNEVVQETTDIKKRTLTHSPTFIDNVDFNDTTETLWYFSPKGSLSDSKAKKSKGFDLAMTRRDRRREHLRKDKAEADAVVDAAITCSGSHVCHSHVCNSHVCTRHDLTSNP